MAARVTCLGAPLRPPQAALRDELAMGKPTTQRPSGRSVAPGKLRDYTRRLKAGEFE